MKMLSGYFQRNFCYHFIIFCASLKSSTAQTHEANELSSWDRQSLPNGCHG